MGRPATLRVDVVTDGSKAGKGLAQAESRFSKFGRTAAKVGKYAALGLGAAVAGAAVGAVKLAKAAAEDEAAASRLANTMRNVTGATRKQIAATEDWITKQGQQLGVADDELRPAMGRLVAATGSVSKAQQLAGLAMNVSAGTGKSLESVTVALAKAQNGSTAGLARLGARTKDAAGNALSLDQITGQLAKTHRGAASKAANTAAGRYGRLKLQLSEAGEAIGAKLLPLGNKLMRWILKVSPGVSKLAGRLGRQLGPVVKSVGRFIGGTLVPAGVRLYRWFVDKIAPGLKRALTPVLAGVRSAFARVSAAVDKNRPGLTKLGNGFKTVAGFLANKVAPILGRLSGTSFRVLGRVIGGIIGTVARLASGISNVVGAIRNLIDWISKIRMPKINIPGLGRIGGSVGNLTTTGVRLVNGPGSYDGRRALASGGTVSSWASVAGGQPLAAVAGPTYVDARTYVTVDGALDEVAVAAKLDKLLARHRRRMGRAA